MMHNSFISDALTNPRSNLEQLALYLSRMRAWILLLTNCEYLIKLYEPISPKRFRAVLLEVAMRRYVFALEIRETNVSFAIVDEAGLVISPVHESLVLEEGSSGFLIQMASLVMMGLRDYPNPAGLGILCAEPLDPVKGVLIDPWKLRGSDGESWGIVPIIEYLSNMFGKNRSRKINLFEPNKFGLRGVASLMFGDYPCKVE